MWGVSRVLHSTTKITTLPKFEEVRHKILCNHIIRKVNAHSSIYMTCILNLYRVEDTSLLQQYPSRPGKLHSTLKAKVSATTKQLQSPNSNSIPSQPNPTACFLIPYILYLKSSNLI